MLKIRLPDNWHAHLRQGISLAKIAYFFNIYGRVLCMGNLFPLVETSTDALRYKEEILDEEVLFEPVMCIMLTQDTTPAMIREAKANGVRFVKFIPVGTSNGASKGLRLDDFERLFKLFPVIIEMDMHLLIHAELISYHADGPIIHYKKREEEAIWIILTYHCNFPSMKITVEHASTERMIDAILFQDSPNLRATLAPQHASLTYGDVFDAAEELVDPLNFCLPVAKDKKDVIAVRRTMVSGDERFIYGPDSAYHPPKSKFCLEPKPGFFLGPAEFPLTVEIFDQEGALGKLEAFTSVFGAEYYSYPLSSETLTLANKRWRLPKSEKGIHYSFGGCMMQWKVIERNGTPINV